MPLFTLITYNVNSVRSRFHVLDYLISRYDPHILCLQETKVADSEFPVSYFEGRGYLVYFSGEKAKSGVAIGYKGGLDVRLLGMGLFGKDLSRLIEVEFDNLKLMNLYVPQGRSPEDEEFKRKLEFLDALIRYIESKYSKNDSLILVGDLNIAPTDIDVHDPKRLYGHVCFRDEVWDAYRRIIEWGFVDVFRMFNPDRVYTFFDYRVKNAIGRGLGWRVDHVLVTSPLVEKVKECFVDLGARKMEKPSDHAPIVAKFDL
ncbi:MAG: exodeoxyribonuclease III [Thermosulfidibacteraceae bacterium]